MKIEDFIRARGQTTPGKISVIFYALFVMTNRIETRYNANLDDLTLKQLMLLILVSISEGETLTRYGEIMGSSRQNIKTLAKSLEKKHYLRITKNKDDRRASGLYLEAKTPEHFATRDALYDDQLVRLFSAFSEEEIDQLYGLLPKFFKGLREMEHTND